MGNPWQPSRRLGLRRLGSACPARRDDGRSQGDRAAGKGGLETASARSSMRAGMARRPGLLGSTEWAEAHADELTHKAVLYINSDTNDARFPERRRQPYAAAIHQRSRCRRDGSGDRRERAGAAARERCRCRAVRGARLRQTRRPRRRPRRAAICRSPPWAPVRISRHSCSTWASHRSMFATAARTTRMASTIPSTTPSITTCASAIRDSPMAWLKRKPSGMRCCAWRTPTCCRCTSPILRETVAGYAGEVRELADEQAQERGRAGQAA